MQLCGLKCNILIQQKFNLSHLIQSLSFEYQIDHKDVNGKMSHEAPVSTEGSMLSAATKFQGNNYRVKPQELWCDMCA